MERVSLLDPILLQSSLTNQNPPKPIKLNWFKFDLLNFAFNIALPLGILIIILFMLKGRYHAKKNREAQATKTKKAEAKMGETALGKGMGL